MDTADKSPDIVNSFLVTNYPLQQYPAYISWRSIWTKPTEKAVS